MANVPTAGSPTVITTNCHPVEQGWMPPSLTGRHRRPSESLLCVGACLGLLLCHDAEFSLLIGVGFLLLRTR
jgi:hypothetical protein